MKRKRKSGTEIEMDNFREKLKTMTKAEKKVLLKKCQTYAKVLYNGDLKHELSWKPH